MLSRWIVLLALPLGCTDGCQDRELLLLPAKADVRGSYCTSAASEHGVPLKIMAIVDTSESNKITDPFDDRQRAVSELINSFINDPEADVEFAVMHFDDTAAVDTVDAMGSPVFTRDPVILTNALNALTRKDGLTNYSDALNAARTLILNDIRQTRDELATLEAMGTNIDLLRPYYFIIFLSDGIPNVQGSNDPTTEDILFYVEALLRAEDPALGITLHTAFLGAPADSIFADQRPAAETLLRRMAEEGKGIFVDFDNGDEIDFSVFDFKILRRFDLKEFVVYNRHAVFENEFIRPDSDLDGISDDLELDFSSDPLLTDTDGDGYRDGLEYAIGYDPNRAEPCSDSDGINDEDNDGLRDCEESLLNFDPKLFDTDKDLFADALEQYSGANPKDSRDIFEDLDFDGRQTEIEIRERTNAGVPESDGIYRQYAYRYEHRATSEFMGQPVAGQKCYTFIVENVGLVATEAVAPLARGANEIVVELVAAPEDDPEDTSVLLRYVHETSFYDVDDFSKPISIDLGDIDLEEISRQTVKE